MPLWVLDGNIASGKTTVLRELEKTGKVAIIYEPVKEWIDMGLLEAFYANKPRWAYTFQNIAMITRLKLLENLDPNKIYIMERSHMTDRFCFAQIAYESGEMTDMEWHAYTLWYDWCRKPTITGNFYLDVSVDTCMERMEKRARSEESRVPRVYLEALKEKHDLMLVSGIHVENVSVDAAVKQILTHLGL
jgi:deoxyadenosine/deoxycytidine kinase